VAEPELSFAGLLRQLRARARLTQEELAEAAGLSPRSVSDLERGVNRSARKDSALLLAGALGLTGQVRVLFVAAARGRAPAADVLAAGDGAAAPDRGAGQGTAPPGAGSAATTRTLPRDISSFTGRDAELNRLLAALAGAAEGSGAAGICAIDGMPGAGKTALAVHAAHRLSASFADGQYFVALHAHTPGQRPVDPADALASLLLTAGVASAQIPPGLEARAGQWRDAVAGQKILLVLDDAAGHEQVRPLLPGTGGSLVLITSRRRLAALEDAMVVSLDALAPAEAAALLARLAGRADLGPDADPAREITRLCGYLPLAIGMLARQLRHHPARGGAELAASLAAARDRLAVMHAENLSVAAAFDLSYQELTADQQRLFRRLGLSPGPDIDAYAAAALDDIGVDTARTRLDELYDHHLITEPAAGRYLLHDLLREYARTLAAADDAKSQAAAGRLVAYYAHAAAAAGQHIATWTTAGGRPPPGDPPAHAPQLATPEEAAAWLEAERLNLHAAVAFAAEASPGHAVAIATAIGGFLRSRGHWDQAAGQYQTALRAARRAGDRAGQAGALDELGLLQHLTSDYPAATGTLTQAAALYRELGDQTGEAYALNHLGLVHLDTGDYPAAAASHQQALNLARDAGDQLAEAVSLTDLALIQLMTGHYPPAAAGYQRALELFRALGSEFDEADVLNELGFLQRQTGDYPAAAVSQQQALDLFRRLGDRLGQAWALGEIGLLQLQTGDRAAAAANLAQALQLHRDLGSRQGESVALNSLGELSTAASAPEEARRCHSQALAITREIGAPLQEARALAGIGRSLLAGHPGDAAGPLREALEIYRRIGTPDARGVQDTLDEYGL
jgi:tetratricopeptide (TPR) repeat protein/transcriptional regulator with XRE-family HTH domain